jgi:hypothetical protein
MKSLLVVLAILFTMLDTSAGLGRRRGNPAACRSKAVITFCWKEIEKLGKLKEDNGHEAATCQEYRKCVAVKNLFACAREEGGCRPEFFWNTWLANGQIDQHEMTKLQTTCLKKKVRLPQTCATCTFGHVNRYCRQEKEKLEKVEEYHGPEAEDCLDYHQCLGVQGMFECARREGGCTSDYLLAVWMNSGSMSQTDMDEYKDICLNRGVGIRPAGCPEELLPEPAISF